MPRSVGFVSVGLILLAIDPCIAALGAEPARERAHRHFIDEFNPYRPGLNFPRLTTPRWVGEAGVEAVVVLAIDDMRDPTVYETFLRPILNRLKAIDGRAPVSIMTNQVNPADPRLQQWLREGVSLEVHTLTHPCPCLQKGDFAEAVRTYHGCVDLMNQIPGNRPVAFRMPCCDSLNTVSPRFFAEIFDRASPNGHFLSIDSSVFTVLTPDDPALPRNLVFEAGGKERFRKYIPFPSFVNVIENYPYPYIIGGACWEFPCIVPSDWEAQNLHRPVNPKTVEDLKAALDCVVIKQGVFNLVFHPHNWIKNTQIVELIDHAVAKHGKKVKFLNFGEALDRLNRNLLGGASLRSAQLQAKKDLIASLDPVSEPRQASASLPAGAFRREANGPDTGLRFVDLDEDGQLDVVFSNDQEYGVYLFDDKDNGWTRKVMAGKAGGPGALPLIARDGRNNGFFVHSRHLWWQNEETARLPNLVDRRSFNELLQKVEPRGKSAAASLKSIQVSPGFHVAIAAAEPLVKDPIAFEWGADGKLWVVEMGDYPLGIDGHGKPGGVVRFLEDIDGDGRYDRGTTFLDGLGFPTGVMPWRGGVVIACAPDIFFAEDRDRDGKADHREVLYTGFNEGNQQHRVNGFEFGLDGWIYGANGDSGGQVRSLKTGKTTPIGGRDFRFRPDTGEFEAESGQSQFGRHRDDWGNWFGNSNPIWGWHFVLADSDLKRNPYHASPDPRHWTEPETRLFPISRALPRFNDPGAANHVTSANSFAPYRDDLFGPEFATSAFVSEPVHNLVHRMVLEPDGATFRAHRGPGETGREFLASSDNWFRPTMVRTGPDGALWIADMYRAVIEHPEWIPDDWEATLDLRAGSEQGRIYRVYPVDKTPRPIPRLDRADTSALVAALESPNGWQRDTAERLLMHRRDPGANEPLRALAKNTNRATTRVQALWTLAVLGTLDTSTAIAGLRDPNAAVRRSVIRTVGPLLATSREVAELVLALADDADIQVRLQVALVLGDWSDHRAGEALGRIAKRDGDDPWMRTALLSSAVPHAGTMLVNLNAGEKTVAQSKIVEPLLALVATMPDQAISTAVTSTIGRPAARNGQYAPWQFTALAGLLTARERGGKPLPHDLDPSLANILESARGLVRDDRADAVDRLAAISLLGHPAARNPSDRNSLVRLVRPQTAPAIQLAALTALWHTSDAVVPKTLLGDWKGHSPRIQGAILDTLLSRDSWTAALLSSLEDGCVPPVEVDPVHRQRLLTGREPGLRERARAVFAQESKPRDAVVNSFRSVLAVKGDALAGQSVFKRLCISCHRFGSDGAEVGPDLASLNDRTPEALLIAILDPNRAFETRYTNFTVATVDGRVLNGLVASESATTVTLRRQEGKEDPLLRSEIEQMTASGQSLMPEGLEKDLRPRDIADLIAYLRSSAPARKPE